MALLSMLGATVIAVFYPLDDTPVLIEPMTLASAPRARIAVPSPTNVTGRRPWLASDENPFAPQTWEAPAPVTEVERPPPVEAPAMPAPPPPPPFPYRFLGQMHDGSVRIFYLGDGEQVLLARQGEVLGGSYKLVTADESAIEFESVQSGTRHSLQIPAQ